MDIEYVRSRFIKHFDGTTGSVYASPGRINLIGEHTDYNGGFVFPGAVDKGMIAEIKPNGTNKVRAYSIDLKDYVEFGLNEEDAPKASWARYIFGVCREMIKRGVDVKGFDTAFAGDVPLGAGMSSSAALESTYAFAINELFGDNKIDKFELAKVGQATEHNYCGVNCGIMDQFASVFGKEGSLIRLDCRSLEYQYFPFKPEGYRLVLVDSVVKHELASSAYNKRRQSCEAAVSAIQKKHPHVEFLRDCTMEMLQEAKAEISEEDYMRAEYVIFSMTGIFSGKDFRTFAVIVIIACSLTQEPTFRAVEVLVYQINFQTFHFRPQVIEFFSFGIRAGATYYLHIRVTPLRIALINGSRRSGYSFPPLLVTDTNKFQVERSRMSHIGAHLSPCRVHITIGEFDQIECILNIAVQVANCYVSFLRYSDIGRKDRSSESEEVPHPFLRTTGSIHRIPIHSFDNNQGRIGG